MGFPDLLFFLVLDKSLPGHFFVLCKGFCLKSAIFLFIWTHPPSDCCLSLSDTQEFTAVTPSREGVISLGHSNHTGKVALVKGCPCFQTRRQPLWERQITWTPVDRPGKNGCDCLSAGAPQSPDPGHTLPEPHVEPNDMSSAPLLGCMLVPSGCMEKRMCNHGPD